MITSDQYNYSFIQCLPKDYENTTKERLREKE